VTGDSDARPLTDAAPGLGGAVIYLIGIPAVGKYTIGKEIARLTQAKLVDNQLINLPAFSILGYDGKDSFPFPRRSWDHIETIREAVLSIRGPCDRHPKATCSSPCPALSDHPYGQFA
jgi:hypothetical protein